MIVLSRARGFWRRPGAPRVIAPSPTTQRSGSRRGAADLDRSERLDVAGVLVDLAAVEAARRFHRDQLHRIAAASRRT